VSDENDIKQSARDDVLALGVRLLVYASILIIPAILFIRFQFLPFDDCLRHAAKVVSGRSWGEIVLLRECMSVDQHPGWHAFLSVLHLYFGMGKEQLVFVEWTLLFIFVSVAAVPFFRRPESWVAAMLLACLALPENYMFRLTRGRPYLLTETVLLVLLALWGRNERKTLLLQAATIGLIALSTFVHGTAWYLWILLVMAFVLSGRKGDAVRFCGCWLVGVLLGAMFTGRPFSYLYQLLEIPFLSFGNGALARMLVGEFQPDSGRLIYLLAIGFVFLVRYVVTQVWLHDSAERFLLTLAAIGWLGGLHVSRLWNEWGLPSAQLWLAFVIQDILMSFKSQSFSVRLVLPAGLCLGLILSASGDLDGRWSRAVVPVKYGDCVNLYSGSSDAGKNIGNDWLPGDGGVVYNSQMDVFDLFFFKYPSGKWRYVYGFEAGLMTEENLKVLRNIQFNHGGWAAYKPWSNAMRAKDRLIVISSGQPEISSLEWLEYEKNLWIGRTITVPNK